MGLDPPLRILIVDDDAEAAEDLAELLEAHGAQVRFAIDEKSALSEVAGEEPNIALIDLQLGNNSGADLARGWHGRPGAPMVILLSGRTLTPAEAMYFGGKAPPLLRKPLDLPKLLVEIAQAFPVSRRRGGRLKLR